MCTRDTKLGTLHDSTRPGDVLRMDYVGHMDGKYLLVKVDFFSRVVQLNVCDAADVVSMLQGIKKWERKLGNVKIF